MTGLRADALRIPVTDVAAAASFYTRVLGSTVANAAVTTVDLRGTGTIELAPSETPLSTGFGGLVVTYILDQPAEIRTVMQAARDHGARILKPAKKALFGSFAGSFIAPDNLIWKLASDKNRDTATPAAEPRPRETTLILGVNEPKKTRGFYTVVGMHADRDYGNKYIDFRPAPSTARLGLMQRPVLAKDVGIADANTAPEITLTHRASCIEEAGQLTSAITSAGGNVIATNSPNEHAAIDPDGFRWLITVTGNARPTP